MGKKKQERKLAQAPLPSNSLGPFRRPLQTKSICL